MKGGEKMYTEKFLEQVHRKLNEQGVTNSKLRDTCIDIYEGDIVILCFEFVRCLVSKN